jgi:hypothetical protein
MRCRIAGDIDVVDCGLSRRRVANFGDLISPPNYHAVMPASLAGAMSRVQHASALTGALAILWRDDISPNFVYALATPRWITRHAFTGKRGATDDDYKWIVFNKHKTAGWR